MIPAWIGRFYDTQASLIYLDSLNEIDFNKSYYKFCEKKKVPKATFLKLRMNFTTYWFIDSTFIVNSSVTSAISDEWFLNE